MTEPPTLSLTGFLICLKPLPLLIMTAPWEGRTVAAVAAQEELAVSTAQAKHNALRRRCCLIIPILSRRRSNIRISIPPERRDQRHKPAMAAYSLIFPPGVAAGQHTDGT